MMPGSRVPTAAGRKAIDVAENFVDSLRIATHFERPDVVLPADIQIECAALVGATSDMAMPCDSGAHLLILLSFPARPIRSRGRWVVRVPSNAWVPGLPTGFVELADYVQRDCAHQIARWLSGPGGQPFPPAEMVALMDIGPGHVERSWVRQRVS